MSIELIKSEINVTRITDDISSAQKLAQSAWNRARKVDNFTKRLNTTIFTIQEMIATADFRSEAPANEAPVRRDISNLRIEEMTSEVEGIVDRLTRLEGDLTETNSFVYDVLLDDLNKKVDELEQATSSRVNKLDKQVTGTTFKVTIVINERFRFRKQIKSGYDETKRLHEEDLRITPGKSRFFEENLR